jgi:hypothetical protein
MKKQILLGIASALVTSSAAFAQTSSTTFGALPAAATYGGSGIDTAQSVITTVSGLPSGDTLTLGLEATPYKQPVGPLDNNQLGTYFATPGISPVKAGHATWNYDFYIGINNAADLGNYTFELIYSGGGLDGSFDPIAVANNDGGLSVTATTREDSEGIGFIPGADLVDPGVYNFELQAFSNGALVGDESISVDVGAAPDATSTMPLLGAALAGLALVRRKFKA